MLKKTGLFLFLSAGLFSLQAQQKIPFRITKNNNIIVKSLVNKKDSLDLMFQIAMRDCSISPERQRKADHIIFNKEEISDDNTLNIGKLSWKNIRFFNHQLTGHEADGKVGTGIFEGKTFMIDYDNNQFVIYDQKQKPDLNGFQPVKIILNNEGLYISADNVVDGKRQQEGYFVLQSGYSGGILYSNDFAEKYELSKKLKVTGEKTLKNSEGQSLITKQAVLPFFKLEKFVFKDVSVGFFSGELKTQNVSYFGADMLRRFIWIFDADREIAYIKPSKYYSEPYYKIN
ncbi:hypothetical protein LF887_08405 [Chryseobacterium sp. MEBOG06]|uniref:hypothetical protein n=1 Tax=unclassified Chryseobacterium TaxID=2593645 RepID=UPI001F39CCFA|nr:MULTISPECIES: hypothetical protein [unclassified Chryseobacterium]UKB85629.1 hypothetical protein LF887_08405 [Chryseobacterium sp. MEBOG06]